MIAAHAEFGDGSELQAGIVSYRANQASLDWEFDGDDAGSAAVTGSAPIQRVEVTAGYYTSVDAHCCPTRMYHQIVGGLTGQPRYGVLSDDRAWLGVEGQKGNSGKVDAVPIIKVYPGTAAARAGLVPGDFILDATEIGHPGDTRGTGAAVIDNIAKHLPGDTVTLLVLRANGEQTSLRAALGPVLGHQPATVDADDLGYVFL